MTMEFMYGGKKSIFYDMAYPVSELQTKIWKSLKFGNATISHANGISNIDIRKQSWNFQINI